MNIHRNICKYAIQMGGFEDDSSLEFSSVKSSVHYDGDDDVFYDISDSNSKVNFCNSPAEESSDTQLLYCKDCKETFKIYKETNVFAPFNCNILDIENIRSADRSGNQLQQHKLILEFIQKETKHKDLFLMSRFKTLGDKGIKRDKHMICFLRSILNQQSADGLNNIKFIDRIMAITFLCKLFKQPKLIDLENNIFIALLVKDSDLFAILLHLIDDGNNHFNSIISKLKSFDVGENSVFSEFLNSLIQKIENFTYFSNFLTENSFDEKNSVILSELLPKFFKKFEELEITEMISIILILSNNDILKDFSMKRAVLSYIFKNINQNRFERIFKEFGYELFLNLTCGSYDKHNDIFNIILSRCSENFPIEPICVMPCFINILRFTNEQNFDQSLKNIRLHCPAFKSEHYENLKNFVSALCVEKNLTEIYKKIFKEFFDENLINTLTTNEFFNWLALCARMNILNEVEKTDFYLKYTNQLDMDFIASFIPTSTFSNNIVKCFERRITKNILNDDGALNVQKNKACHANKTQSNEKLIISDTDHHWQALMSVFIARNYLNNNNVHIFIEKCFVFSIYKNLNHFLYPVNFTPDINYSNNIKIIFFKFFEWNVPESVLLIPSIEESNQFKSYIAKNSVKIIDYLLVCINSSRYNQILLRNDFLDSDFIQYNFGNIIRRLHLARLQKRFIEHGKNISIFIEDAAARISVYSRLSEQDIQNIVEYAFLNEDGLSVIRIFLSISPSEEFRIQIKKQIFMRKLAFSEKGNNLSVKFDRTALIDLRIDSLDKIECPKPADILNTLSYRDLSSSLHKIKIDKILMKISDDEVVALISENESFN